MDMDHKGLKSGSKELDLSSKLWDLGPRTLLQDERKVLESAAFIDPSTGKSINPNGVVRCRRESWVHVYLRKGKLTDRQASTADELLAASAGLRAADPLAALRIDRSRGDMDPVADRIDRRAKFRKMWAFVPEFARPVVMHVVLLDNSLRSIAGCSSGTSEARHLDRLQRGLDHLDEKWS